MSIIDDMGRPTITDVAKKSGVSKTTVSVILNKSPASERVSRETQDRVRLVAEQLGYRPNWRACALSNQRTHTIGVLYTPPMPIVVRGNYEGIMIGINEVLHVPDITCFSFRSARTRMNGDRFCSINEWMDA